MKLGPETRHFTSRLAMFVRSYGRQISHDPWDKRTKATIAGIELEYDVYTYHSDDKKISKHFLKSPSWCVRLEQGKDIMLMSGRSKAFYRDITYLALALPKMIRR